MLNFVLPFLLWKSACLGRRKNRLFRGNQSFFFHSALSVLSLHWILISMDNPFSPCGSPLCQCAECWKVCTSFLVLLDRKSTVLSISDTISSLAVSFKATVKTPPLKGSAVMNCWGTADTFFFGVTCAYAAVYFAGCFVFTFMRQVLPDLEKLWELVFADWVEFWSADARVAA